MAGIAAGLSGILRSRSLFILLVLANLLFFAWGQRYFGETETGREPQRLARQLSPEKLRIGGAVAPSAAPSATACRLVGGLSPDEAQRLRTQAGEKGLSLQLDIRPADGKPGLPAQLVVRGRPELLTKQLLELLSTFPTAKVADCPLETRQ